MHVANDFHFFILDEWTNFLERLGPKASNEEIQYWASFRGQTLSRTGDKRTELDAFALICFVCLL